MKDIRFLKNFARHSIFFDEAVPEAFIPHLKIKQNNGDFIFSCLYKKIVRSSWNDHAGFPIKKQFYDNGMLASCVSIRTLAIACGYSDQKVQKLLKAMEEFGWIKKYNEYTKKHQSVYVLGVYTKEWSTELNRYIYSESMYRDQVMDQALGLDALEIEPKKEYDFDSLHNGNVNAFFEK